MENYVNPIVAEGEHVSLMTTHVKNNFKLVICNVNASRMEISGNSHSEISYVVIKNITNNFCFVFISKYFRKLWS